MYYYPQQQNQYAAAAQDTPTQTQDLKAAPPHITNVMFKKIKGETYN